MLAFKMFIIWTLILALQLCNLVVNATQVSFLYHDIGQIATGDPSDFTPYIVDSDTIVIDAGESNTLYDLYYKELDFTKLTALQITFNIHASVTNGDVLTFYVGAQGISFMNNVVPGGVGLSLQYFGGHQHVSGLYLISPDGTFDIVSNSITNSTTVEISFNTNVDANTINFRYAGINYPLHLDLNTWLTQQAGNLIGIMERSGAQVLNLNVTNYAINYIYDNGTSDTLYPTSLTNYTDLDLNLAPNGDDIVTSPWSTDEYVTTTVNTTKYFAINIVDPFERILLIGTSQYVINGAPKVHTSFQLYGDFDPTKSFNFKWDENYLVGDSFGSDSRMYFGIDSTQEQIDANENALYIRTGDGTADLYQGSGMTGTGTYSATTLRDEGTYYSYEVRYMVYNGEYQFQLYFMDSLVLTNTGPTSDLQGNPYWYFKQSDGGITRYLKNIEMEIYDYVPINFNLNEIGYIQNSSGTVNNFVPVLSTSGDLTLNTGNVFVWNDLFQSFPGDFDFNDLEYFNCSFGLNLTDALADDIVFYFGTQITGMPNNIAAGGYSLSLQIFQGSDHTRGIFLTIPNGQMDYVGDISTIGLLPLSLGWNRTVNDDITISWNGNTLNVSRTEAQLGAYNGQYFGINSRSGNTTFTGVVSDYLVRYKNTGDSLITARYIEDLVPISNWNYGGSSISSIPVSVTGSPINSLNMDVSLDKMYLYNITNPGLVDRYLLETDITSAGALTGIIQGPDVSAMWSSHLPIGDSSFDFSFEDNYILGDNHNTSAAMIIGFGSSSVDIDQVISESKLVVQIGTYYATASYNGVVLDKKSLSISEGENISYVVSYYRADDQITITLTIKGDVILSQTVTDSEGLNENGDYFYMATINSGISHYFSEFGLNLFNVVVSDNDVTSSYTTTQSFTDHKTETSSVVIDTSAIYESKTIEESAQDTTTIWESVYTEITDYTTSTELVLTTGAALEVVEEVYYATNEYFSTSLYTTTTTTPSTTTTSVAIATTNVEVDTEVTVSTNATTTVWESAYTEVTDITTSTEVFQTSGVELDVIKDVHYLTNEYYSTTLYSTTSTTPTWVTTSLAIDTVYETPLTTVQESTVVPTTVQLTTTLVTTDEFKTSTVVLSTSGVEVEVQPELYVIQNIYSTESFYTTATVTPFTDVISQAVETHTIYDTESTSTTQSTTTTLGVLQQTTDTIITTAAVTDVSNTVQTAYATTVVNGTPNKSSAPIGIIVGASIGGVAALSAAAILVYRTIAINPLSNAVAFVEGTEIVTDNPLYHNPVQFQANELYSSDYIDS